MTRSLPNKAHLLLADGTLISGKSLGKHGYTIGEMCFNTGMTGYQELYTDPSYFGQIIVNTMTHIGNYGTLSTEVESGSVKFAGLVCDQFSLTHSRKQAESSLQHYLETYGITGICEVDTRKLVRHLRAHGVMNGIIGTAEYSPETLAELLKQAPNMENLELSTKVTTDHVYEAGDFDGDKLVAVLDLGIKSNILRQLGEQGVKCLVFPATTSFQEMESHKPDGYFISNGPGDPSAMDYAINTVKRILESQKPLFGICMGHQILALAHGVPTYKMHHGHRGLNHPVKNLLTGRCEITSQNHGFAVSEASIEAHPSLEVTHINLNDNTVEGIRTRNGSAFSVQYHPESAPGPHDSRYLFASFRELLNS